MIQYTVHIDRLKLQIDFLNSSKQREIMDELVRALYTSYPFLNVEYNTNHMSSGAYTNAIYTGGSKILELTSGAFKDKNKRTIYFITVEIAGLKQYNKNDKITYDCLIRVVAYLNTYMIDFNYTGIDIAVDMECPFVNTYGFCNKKSARKKNYYKVGEIQPYATTHYIEKYNHTHNRVMKRSYLYDKSIKQGNIYYPLTRFELKLQSNLFNRHPYTASMLQEQLDKYHILYFPTVDEKYQALSLYAANEDTIRRRDLHKLGLEQYRIVPDISEIEDLLIELYDVREHDLGLPVKSVDDKFDIG